MSRKLGPTIADIAREEGMEEGMEKGMEKGVLKGRREDLQAVLEDRFGSLPEEVLQRIMTCDDPQRLQAALRQTSRMQSLAELPL